MNHQPFIATPGKKIKLKDYDPRFTGKFNEKEDAQGKLTRDIERLASLQDILYAQNTWAILVIFQAMDAAGKDSAIKHVLSGVNPQGCQVFSFKAPSAEELDHDYLWRCTKALPERGRIGIFNRSYYEEVLVVRVHPAILDAQKVPARLKSKAIWKQRYEDINCLERYLTRNGVAILKFFLHVSKEEQKERFLERIDRPEKNWKFSIGDVKERDHWSQYMKAYEEMITATSTRWAPWYIVPADRKWFTRIAIADIMVGTLKSLSLKYPSMSDQHRKDLVVARKMLESE